MPVRPRQKQPAAVDSKPHLPQKKEKNMSSVQHVSSGSFTPEVLQSPLPVLVDFYADWCGPCRLLAPTLDRLATEFGSRAKIVKVNIDREPVLASQFQIQSIPTLVIVADGTVVARASGLIPEAALRNALNQVAGTGAPPERRVV
jgi:thioredoxin